MEKILGARVVVIGAGGLGCPCLLYLAAAGVGHIGIVDHDTVALSNLQRQVLHETASIGVPKVESAKEALHDLNPEVRVIPHQVRLTAENAEAILAQYDVVIDGCDNIETRYLVNDTCLKLKKPLVSGAIHGLEGQLAVFQGYLPDAPCYRCLYPEPPPPEAIPVCSESGVFGPLAGIVGSWMAAEALLLIAKIPTSNHQLKLLSLGVSSRIKNIHLAKSKQCVC